MDFKPTGMQIELSPTEVSQLHAEIQNLLSDAGYNGVADRDTMKLPTVFTVFDKLYESGMAS